MRHSTWYATRESTTIVETTNKCLQILLLIMTRQQAPSLGYAGEYRNLLEELSKNPEGQEIFI